MNHKPDGYPIRRVAKSRLSAPFLWADWCFQWVAYWASTLAVFRVLEYAGKLTVLVALVVWIAEIPERDRTAIRSAWSVVNSRGGGRKEALEYLVRRRTDLRGLNGAGGYFGKISLKGLDLSWSDLTDANFDDADLEGANFGGSKLVGASFKNANLAHASFRYSTLSSMPPTQFDGAKIEGADFRDIIFPGLGSAYLDTSFAAARGWDSAAFDEKVRKDILEYSQNPMH